MKVKALHLGAWIPGSTIHLKEFYQALGFAKSGYFDTKQIKEWRKGLEAEHVEYHAGIINSVSGVFKNGVGIEVSEDGMMILSSEVEDVKKDLKRVKGFMTDKIRPFWEKLHSRDAGLPKIMNEYDVVVPMILEVSSGTLAEMEALVEDLDVVINKRFKIRGGDVWIADRLVILKRVKFKPSEKQAAFQYLMFARLYELQMKLYLRLQRKLWNQIAAIRHRTYYKNTELPAVRERTIAIQSQAGFFRSRSKQLEQFLSWREQFISSYVKDKTLQKTFLGFFRSLRATQHYLHELWEMTDTYARNTVQSVSLLYSDNQSRELRTLQKLFLISAVASVISLGTYVGSQTRRYTAEGVLDSIAITRLWSIDSFIIFSVLALLISVIIHIFFYLIFTKFQRKQKVVFKEQNGV